MPKIAVYDTDNKARLLGFLHTAARFHGERLSLAVMPRIPVHAAYRSPFAPMPDEAPCRKVTFKREWLSKITTTEATDWYCEEVRKRQAVLTTSASLGLLTQLREFSLPQDGDDDTREAEAAGKEAAKNASFY